MLRPGSLFAGHAPQGLDKDERYTPGWVFAGLDITFDTDPANVVSRVRASAQSCPNAAKNSGIDDASGRPHGEGAGAVTPTAYRCPVCGATVTVHVPARDRPVCTAGRRHRPTPMTTIDEEEE